MKRTTHVNIKGQKKKAHESSISGKTPAANEKDVAMQSLPAKRAKQRGFAAKR